MICQGCVKKVKSHHKKRVDAVHPELAFLRRQAKNMILQLSMNEILMVLVYKNPFQLKILITKLST